MVTGNGSVISAGHPGNRTVFDFFMATMPFDQLNRMNTFTTSALAAKGKRQTSIGEILKFIGVLILATRYEFGDRAELWSTESSFKYIPAASFGKKTGMSRCRFDDLWSCMGYSETSLDSEVEENSLHSKWKMVKDFVDAINMHREVFFYPSSSLCIDESIIRWYGLGGKWIQKGLPHYVSIDRKPESGCEVQNVCCGTSGIMLKLHLVTGEQPESDNTAPLSHTVQLVKSLVEPWAHTGRIVCADSYFSSFETSKELLSMGLYYTGVVKNATRCYPMAQLSSCVMRNRGDTISYTHKDTEGNEYLALCWVDRERRYFISSCGRTDLGNSYTRVRWRQTEHGADRSVLTVDQPKVVEHYYSVCSRIDRHNRSRQDDLQLEKKFVTQDWTKRVNLSLLGFCIVDSWLLYSGSYGDASHLSQRKFYAKLSEELIENSWDQGISSSASNRAESSADIMPTFGIGSHLTPTKKRRRNREGDLTNFRAQRACFFCKAKGCTNVCSTCRYDDGLGEVFLCSAKKSNCFALHCNEKHRQS